MLGLLPIYFKGVVVRGRRQFVVATAAAFWFARASGAFAKAAPVRGPLENAEGSSAELAIEAVELLQAFLLRVVGAPQVERMSGALSLVGSPSLRSDGPILSEIAAYGVLVRGQPLKDSVGAGLHRSSKRALQRAQVLFGALPWLLALHGAWHFEVARRSAVAAPLLGASKEAGGTLLEAALAAQSEDGGIAMSYAVTLLSDDAPRYSKAVLAALVDAQAKSSRASLPRSAYFTMVDKHSSELVRLLKNGAQEQAGAYARELF